MTRRVRIDERDARVLHGLLLATHGGGTGVRDEGLFQSALARPQQHQAYAGKADIFELAAVHTAGIVRNHPFVDGNKRTGFLLGILFLELNGYRFAAAEEDATRAVLDLASGVLNDDEFAMFLRANSIKQ